MYAILGGAVIFASYWYSHKSFLLRWLRKVFAKPPEAFHGKMVLFWGAFMFLGGAQALAIGLGFTWAAI